MFDPGEFWAQFGPPKVRIVPAAVAGVELAPADPDRYILWIICDTTNQTIIPNDERAGATLGINLTAGVPLALSFGNHGTLTQCRWVTQAIGIACNFTVIECVARGRLRRSFDELRQSQVKAVPE